MIIQCPRCLTRFRWEYELLHDPGTSFKCSRCGHVFEDTETTEFPNELDVSFDDEQPEEELDLSPSFDDPAPPSIAPAEDMESAGGTSNYQLYSRVLLTTLIVYSALSLALYLFPRVGLAALGSIPWIGPTLVTNHRVHEKLILNPVVATFETLKDDRTALVISGLALNANKTDVAEIEIEARTYDSRGRELNRKVISGGNGLSHRIVKDLTAKDISLLQAQKARKQFVVPKKESMEFVVVFLNPNPRATRFRVRVLSARAHV